MVEAAVVEVEELVLFYCHYLNYIFSCYPPFLLSDNEIHLYTIMLKRKEIIVNPQVVDQWELVSFECYY